jgi:S-adenosylmethionine uptake transporter
MAIDPASLRLLVLLRAGAVSSPSPSFVIALAHMAIGDITAITQTTPLLILIGVALIWREPIGGLRTRAHHRRLSRRDIEWRGREAVRRVSLPCLICGGAVFGGATRGAQHPSRHPILIATFATLAIVMIAAGLMVGRSDTGSSHAALHLASWHWPVSIDLRPCAFFSLTASRRRGTVAPFYYCFTVWAVISGVVVFGDIPDRVADRRWRSSSRAASPSW